MPRTVMIVDDSESMRTVARLVLERDGYEVVEATDGRDALAKLGQARPHLIVCDVSMPHMDGFDFLKHVRAFDEHRFTPVIMLTTEARPAHKALGRAAGARVWITKPCLPSDLAAAVNKLCP